MRGAGHLTHGVVHVRAEGLPARVAVEQWRKDVQRQRRGTEEGIARERGHDGFPDPTRGWVILGNLLVVLRARGLMSCRDAAVHPFGGVEQSTRLAYLRRVQNARDLQQHQNPSSALMEIERPVPGM